MVFFVVIDLEANHDAWISCSKVLGLTELLTVPAIPAYYMLPPLPGFQLLGVWPDEFKRKPTSTCCLDPEQGILPSS
jgi:hypothetical protein